MAEQPIYTRLRVTFGKNGPARWTGHLDVNRTWERALNRAKIPMAYTQGFNRRPRMQFASALSLGYTSRCEVVDLWLTEPLEPALALERLTAKMAPGIEIIAAREVPVKQDALPTLAIEAKYTAQLTFVDIDSATLQIRVDELLAKDVVEWEKAGRKNKGKFYDMRPFIFDLQAVEGDPPRLHFHVQNIEGKTGRPAHIMAAMGIDPLDAKIERTALIFKEIAQATV